ncbi:AlpA family phage regulatory protein [Synechococcus sp. UW140]|uniref:helix-turn-helix transcriptional regulator n=1 Tax=Synechococcus sp. UW140 TaxID=368503 RepID=UPI003137F5FB
MEPIFLRINDVIKLTSISRSSIYRMMSDGDFPVQISVGNRQVRWSRQEVLDWCEEKLTTEK